jgi:hypothetical protein
MARAEADAIGERIAEGYRSGRRPGPRNRMRERLRLGTGRAGATGRYLLVCGLAYWSPRSSISPTAVAMSRDSAT